MVRGVCGGFLFGIPMLYTIEVWWIGSLVSPPRLLAVLLITLLCTYLLSSTAGFRKSQATTTKEAFEDAVEAIALGTLCATIMLIILQQITFSTQLSETLGKIILESVPFSLGVGLANQFLKEADESEEIALNGTPDSTSNDTSNDASNGTSNGTQSSDNLSSKTVDKVDKLFPENNLNETISDVGATLLGAIIIAFSIAPTDEVDVLVAAIDGPWLLLIVLISLALSYCIVFQANFTRQRLRQQQKGIFQGPLSETIFSYLLSLIAAALMLSFFGKTGLHSQIDTAFRQVLILGLPATIGGAAGRLAV